MKWIPPQELDRIMLKNSPNSFCSSQSKRKQFANVVLLNGLKPSIGIAANSIY